MAETQYLIFRLVDERSKWTVESVPAEMWHSARNDFDIRETIYREKQHYFVGLEHPLPWRVDPNMILDLYLDGRRNITIDLGA